MYCSACAHETDSAPCASCGADPLLDGRYRLDERLAAGRFATTWRATRREDGLVIAIKESLVRHEDVAKLRELVDREVRVLRQLAHPQIPAYLEHVETSRGRTCGVWLVQEYIAGVDLQRGLADRRWTEREVLEVMDELCVVLAYLHALSPPVVHRDVKPSNVVRTNDGRLVLVDFGSVRDALRDPDLGGSTVAGTFGYMAPEQFAGDASPRSDLYGLGAFAVALLTRQDPARLQGPDRTVVWRGHCDPSPGTARLLDALLAPDPADRPPSAVEVRARIAPLLEAPTVAVPVKASARPTEPGIARVTLADRPTDSPEPFPEPLARPEVAGLLGGIGVLSFGLVGFLIFAIMLGTALALRPVAVDVAATRLAARPIAGAWPVLDRQTWEAMPNEVTCIVPRLTLKARDCPSAWRDSAWVVVAGFPGEGEVFAVTYQRASRPAAEWVVGERASYDLGGPLPSDVAVRGLDREPEFVLDAVPPVGAPVAIGPVTCRATVTVAADGTPSRAIVTCPRRYHPPTMDALGQWRWPVAADAAIVDVEVAFAPLPAP